MRSAQIAFPILVQDFFCRHLVDQRGASARTIEGYRDAFELLLSFIRTRKGTRDEDLPNPASLATAQRVLAIPAKRFDHPVLGYLTREQVTAILAAPDQTNWTGHRDAVMLGTLYNTGARVSEIAGLRVGDILLDRTTAVHLHGKGRKDRAIPLWKMTAGNLRAWLHRAQLAPESAAFPNRAGQPMTRSGIRDRLDRAVAIAEVRCPSLKNSRISPHTLRHSTAMHLLQSGVDLSMIALWLGHPGPATTHQYLEVDLAMKEETLGHLSDPSPTTQRYVPDDKVLAFLDSL